MSGQGAAILSKGSGISVGLAIVLVGGVAGLMLMLVNLSDRFVTKEFFTAQMSALRSEIRESRADTRADIANLRADLMIRLAGTREDGDAEGR